MYLEPWNDGYWLTEFYIQPNYDEEPCINEELFRDLQYEIYPEGELKDDKSVMVRVEDRYYELQPDPDIPTDVLELPEGDFGDLRIDAAAKRRPILVVKPWFQEYVAWEQAT